MITLSKMTGILMLAMLLDVAAVSAQPYVISGNGSTAPHTTNITRTFIAPTQIVWTSDNFGKSILNPKFLLKPGIGQAVLNKDLVRKAGKVEYQQFFDLKNDPWETTNLAANGNWNKNMVKMRSILKQWEDETETSTPVINKEKPVEE